MSCWWLDPAEVAQLVRWMAERGLIDETFADAVLVMDKPWKWSMAYTDMQAEFRLEHAA